MVKKVHKQGKITVESYFAFGKYQQNPTALCSGAKGLYAGHTYLISRYWKDVTCKHCLNKNLRQVNK